MSYALGDVVQLKSGGPAMTVTDADPREAQCRWFDGSKNMVAVFPQGALQAVEAPPKAGATWRSSLRGGYRRHPPQLSAVGAAMPLMRQAAGAGGQVGVAALQGLRWWGGLPEGARCRGAHTTGAG